MTGCINNSPSVTVVPPSPSASPIVVPSSSPVVSPSDLGTAINLNALNNSGEFGTATLTETTDQQTSVVLRMQDVGEPMVTQPAHINIGRCPNPGEVKYPLNDVVNGTSTTILNLKFLDIINSADQLAVSITKSASESSVFVSCGDLK